MFTENMVQSDLTVISKLTKKHSQIASDFFTVERYDLIDEQPRNYFINRFWTIGFADPFPNDDEFIIGSVDDIPDDLATPCKVEDHVYPCIRYTEGNSPYCIYIPSREVMLKLMRACIKVKKPEDLWINQVNK